MTVRAQVDRAGRSLSSVSGRLEQDGKLIGLAVGAWSKPWESPLLEDAPMPQVAPPPERRRSLRELAEEAAAAAPDAAAFLPPRSLVT